MPLSEDNCILSTLFLDPQAAANAPYIRSLYNPLAFSMEEKNEAQDML